jgi:hypothetical protein
MHLRTELNRAPHRRLTRVARLLVEAGLFSALASAAGAEAPSCACDCDENGIVAISEAVTAVNVALEIAPRSACPAADANRDGRVAVDEIVSGVRFALNGCPAASTPTLMPPTATPTEVASATSTPDTEPPPANAQELLAWLRAGRYLAWPAESAIHQSGGPHFGRVRTFVNPVLFGSLSAAASSHPAGAAAVKELYGAAGGDLLGWSVMIKVQAESAGGNGWYWYERFRDTVYGSGLGIGGCTGCHGGGFGSFVSKDFVLAPFPLQ